MTRLSASTVRELLDYDMASGAFFWRERDNCWFHSPGQCRRWNAMHANRCAGSMDICGYLQICILGTRYQAHRVAWICVTGEWPDDQIDHINGIRSDNRFENLRVVSHAQNQRNRGIRSDNTSGFTGVTRHNPSGRFMAKIKFQKKCRYLGLFDTAEMAHAAYARAARDLGYSKRHICGDQHD